MHKFLQQEHAIKSVDLFENCGVAMWHENASALYAALCHIQETYGSVGMYLQQNPQELPRLIDLITIVNVNSHAVSLFKAQNKEELCSGIRGFFMKESYFDFFKMLVHLFAGHSSYTYTSSKMTKYGHKTITRVTVSVPEDYKNSWEHMFVSEVDIASFVKREVSLKRKIEKAEIMLESKEKLLSIIAHDLKNPFNNILGFSELILQKFDSINPNNIQEYLQYIHESACHSYHLLSNLLQWGGTKQLVSSAQIEKICVYGIIHEVIDLVKSACITKEIEVKTNISEDHYAFADYNMTSFVIRNVVTNAIKFSFAKSYIYIRTYTQNNLLHIEVRDFGIGMDTHIQGSLFCVETAQPRAGTCNELGTGIGLILCKEFIEKQSGSLTIDAEEGAGTIVTVSLPLQKFHFA